MSLAAAASTCHEAFNPNLEITAAHSEKFQNPRSFTFTHVMISNKPIAYSESLGHWKTRLWSLKSYYGCCFVFYEFRCRPVWSWRVEIVQSNDVRFQFQWFTAGPDSNCSRGRERDKGEEMKWSICFGRAHTTRRLRRRLVSYQINSTDWVSESTRIENKARSPCARRGLFSRQQHTWHKERRRGARSNQEVLKKHKKLLNISTGIIVYWGGF